MKEILVPYRNKSVTIKFGENITKSFIAELKLKHPLLIITDQNIWQLYHNLFANEDIIIVPEGENAKSITTYQMVIENLLQRNVEKNTVLVALGGGSISDITGFVANTYKRGLRYINIPTTLLSQIDASIGGKNALNLGSIKNQVGTIYQPDYIIIDPIFLKTLKTREFHSGMAEAIKYALLYDKALFTAIETQTFNLNDLIYRCVEIKAKVTEIDEFDLYERRALNFGHTIGHAIEALSHLSYTHGEAIAWGMYFEIDNNLRPRIHKVLKQFTLLPELKFSLDEIFSLINTDKKIDNEEIMLAKVKTIGEFKIVKQPVSSLYKELADEHLW